MFEAAVKQTGKKMQSQLYYNKRIIIHTTKTGRESIDAYKPIIAYKSTDSLTERIYKRL